MQTKRIPLYGRDGVVAWATVDAADYDELVRYRWWMSRNGYALRSPTTNGDNVKVRMHRQILGLTSVDDGFVDHINRDKLDNRRANLRRCTFSENLQNLPSRKGSTSKYRGVYWDKGHGRWRANCTIDGKPYYLGRFDTEEEAAAAASAFRAKHMPFSDDALRVA